MADRRKLDIYTDGGCPFCQWMRAWVEVEARDSGGVLNFLDYNDPALAAATPFTFEELDREMHVRTPDGAWAAGFGAWAEILRRLPSLAWLGRLMNKLPLRQIGPGIYRFVARHRVILSRLVPGAPPACTPHSCEVTRSNRPNANALKTQRSGPNLTGRL